MLWHTCLASLRHLTGRRERDPLIIVNYRLKKPMGEPFQAFWHLVWLYRDHVVLLVQHSRYVYDRQKLAQYLPTDQYASRRCFYNDDCHGYE